MLITTYALVTSNRSIQSSSCVKANTLAPKAMAALTTAHVMLSVWSIVCQDFPRLLGGQARCFSMFLAIDSPRSAPLDEFLVYIKAVAASGANACKLQRSELLHELLCILCGNMSVSGNMDHWVFVASLHGFSNFLLLWPAQGSSEWPRHTILRISLFVHSTLLPIWEVKRNDISVFSTCRRYANSEKPVEVQVSYFYKIPRSRDSKFQLDGPWSCQAIRLRLGDCSSSGFKKGWESRMRLNSITFFESTALTVPAKPGFSGASWWKTCALLHTAIPSEGHGDISESGGSLHGWRPLQQGCRAQCSFESAHKARVEASRGWSWCQCWETAKGWKLAFDFPSDDVDHSNSNAVRSASDPGCTMRLQLMNGVEHQK